MWHLLEYADYVIFIDQLLLLIKISNLLLISVFLIKVFNPQQMLKDSSSSQPFVRFLMQTFAFTQKLIEGFESLDRSDNNLFSSISNIIKNTKNEDLELLHDSQEVLLTVTKPSYFFVNLYGVAMISIQLLSTVVVEVCHVI